MATGWWTMTREEYEARKKRLAAATEVGFPYQKMGIAMPSGRGDAPAKAAEIKEYFVLARTQRAAFLQGLADWGHAINARYN